MILYDENKSKITIQKQQKIGEGMYGSVYKLSDAECIKVYKTISEMDIDVLKVIKSLKLKNFYQILEIYYNKQQQFKAIKTVYYNPEEIDILTMPIEYTLDNLFNIYNSIEILTKNNILVEDTHSENIIIDKNNITIIDTDLYVFNRHRTAIQLQIKNIEKLAYLFKDLYTEAIKKYHNQIQNYEVLKVIADLFSFYTPNQLEETYKKLVKYKYPIDYITKSR